MKLEVDIETFMVDRIIDILDKSQSLIIIQVFPKRICKFQSSITFLTPFIFLDDLKVSNIFKITFFTEILEILQGFI